MNKVQLIEVAEQSFTLSHDAFKKLDTYLSKLAQYYDEPEVLKDIEMSIADKLKAKMTGSKDVLNLEDVESVILELGTIEDLTGEPDPHSQSPKSTKKLMRSRHDVKAGGVAAGLGDYFDIDPTFVRLAFVVSTILFSGSTAIIYLILWAVLPQAMDSEDDRRMKGQGGTLKDIEEAVRAKTSNLKVDDQPVLIRLATKLTSLLVAIVRFGLRLNGFILAAVSALILLIVSSFSASLATYGNEHDTLFEIGDATITNFPINDLDYALIGTIWLTLALLFSLTLLLGISLLRLKSVLRGPTAGFMVALLLASATFAAAIAAKSADRFNEVVKLGDAFATHQIEEIDEITVSDHIIVEFIPSPFNKIEIFAKDLVIDEVDYKVEDGNLKVGLKPGYESCFYCTDAATIKVYAPQVNRVTIKDESVFKTTDANTINSIEVSDSARGIIENTIVTDITQSGESQLSISMPLEATAANVLGSDSSFLTLECAKLLDNFAADLSGESQIDIKECVSDNSNILTRDDAQAKVITNGRVLFYDTSPVDIE